MLLLQKYLKFALLLLLLLDFYNAKGSSPSNDILALVEQKRVVNQKRVAAAFAAMETVKEAGAYVDALSDLFDGGIVTLPVGIRKGAYELIIREISYNKETDKNRVLASCAFVFKENGQRMAFEGYVDVEGQKGMGTSGSLALVTPVRRDMGPELTLIFNEGTRVNFGCEGIESFYARMDLLVDSVKIKPLDATGKPTGGWLSTSFDGYFEDFDNYSLSISFNQSFGFEGLDGFVFTLDGATLDQSDVFTPASARFPEGYGIEGDETTRNLWKGIAITSAKVTLPEFFSKPGLGLEADATPSLEQRLTLDLENAIFDNNGFSGRVVTETEVFSSELLDKDRWDISLHEFSLELLKGSVAGLGFGGDINIPPFGKNSLLPYRASFNHSINNYEFEVGLAGEFDLPVLGCTVDLNRNSYIEIVVEDGGIYPTINASGILSIDAPLGGGDQPKKLKIPDIPFENMRISRAAPYFEIGSVGLTGELRTPELAGFELYLENIGPFLSDKGGGLRFDAGVKLSEVFGGEAGIQLYGNYAQWKFDRVAVDRIAVNFKSGGYSVDGDVEFKEGDDIYGSGFRGDVEFTLIDRFTFDAVAVFGKKDNYRYFLTDVFYEKSPSGGIVLVGTPISFYGFGGGLYRRMQQSYSPDIQSEFGKSLSGINYIPDKSVGMGFMTATKFGLIAPTSAFNAKVGFEIQFNDDGGLNFVQLRGDASFMNDPEKWGNLADNINQAVDKLEERGGKIQLTAKSDLKVPENKSDGFLTASMLMEYDAAHKVFTADLNAYLNAGFIKGVGKDGRMGWASIRVSNDDWYAYLGTPSDRLGVEILGLAKTAGYFMLGDNIPELPLPPQKVLKNFSKAKQDKLNSRSTYDMAQGSGIAFGQSLEVGFNAELTPFYARMGVGLGAEFLLKNYGINAYCAGGEPPLGINGWYARAQAWAWVEADIGLQAKVFGRRRSFSILDLSASALLEGAGPNPFYFSGAVGGRFSVMGGLISGRCNFDFEIGEECKVMGGSPFGEEIIAQLTPSKGESDVNVFVAPQAVFNIPVGLEMEVEEDAGKKAWYRVTLETFECVYQETGQTVSGAHQYTDEGRVLVLDPDEALESQSDLIVRAKVGFERRVSGAWKKVLGYDGQPVYEEKEVAFKSGDRPKFILPEHVKYSYPVDRQYNYYSAEYDQGYLMLSENYNYLFTTDIPEGYTQEIRLTDSNGNAQTTDFSFKTHGGGNDIKMEIDFTTGRLDFENDEIYGLALLNVPMTIAGINENIATTSTQFGEADSLFVEKKQAEGALELLEEDQIYAMNFRTSSYDTFVEKMGNVKNFAAGKWQINAHVYQLISNIDELGQPTEMFDYYEHNTPQPEQNLVEITPDYQNTQWYSNQIKLLIYENEALKRTLDLQELHPPMQEQVVVLGLYSHEISVTDEVIRSGSRPAVSRMGAISYNVAKYVDSDLVAFKNRLANRLIAQGKTDSALAGILKADHVPAFNSGEYPLMFNYRLPGKEIQTFTVRRKVTIK